MKHSLTEKLGDFIASKPKSFLESDKIKKFEEASKQFQKLIDLGMVQKRGYTLQTIDRSHFNTASFNK